MLKAVKSLTDCRFLWKNENSSKLQSHKLLDGCKCELKGFLPKSKLNSLFKSKYM